MEPGEGKAHEMGETPEEETREGAEPDDKPIYKTNRKRSAKGATNTKAPMDGEGCGCGGSGRKGKASCDGGCGGYAKKDRNDALTPQEYLAACELGIQGRSRPYIRARLDTAMNLTPSTVRADLKCGRGSISQGEKCTKGAAQKAAAVATLAGFVGNAAATGYAAGKAIGGDFKGAARGLQIAGASQAIAGLGARGMGMKKEGNELLRGGALTAAGGTLIREGLTGEIGKGIGRAKNSMLGKQLRYAPSNAVGRVRIAAMRNKPMPKPKMKKGKVANPWLDSVYAAGFSPELDQLAI
jgi:hypothetical protein